MESNFMKLLTKATSNAETAPSPDDPVNPKEIRDYIDESFGIVVRRRWISSYHAKTLVPIAKTIVVEHCWSMTHAVQYVNRMIYQNCNPVIASLLSSRKPSSKVRQEMVEDHEDDRNLKEEEEEEDEEEGEEKKKNEEEDGGEESDSSGSTSGFADSVKNYWSEENRDQTEARLGRNLEKFLSEYAKRDKHLIPEVVKRGEKRNAVSEPPMDIKIAKISDDGDATL